MKAIVHHPRPLSRRSGPAEPGPRRKVEVDLPFVPTRGMRLRLAPGSEMVTVADVELDLAGSAELQVYIEDPADDSGERRALELPAAAASALSETDAERLLNAYRDAVVSAMRPQAAYYAEDRVKETRREIARHLLAHR